MNDDDLKDILRKVSTKKTSDEWYDAHHKMIGVIMIIAGIGLGLYVGGYLMFIGGIIQIIEAFAVTPVLAISIAWGIIKVMLAAACGWIIVLMLVIPGFIMLTDHNATRRNVGRRHGRGRSKFNID